GQILSDDLDGLVHKDPAKGNFGLGHLCLITYLCADKDVLIDQHDEFEQPTRPVTLKFLEEVRTRTGGRRFVPFAEDGDLMEYAEDVNEDRRREVEEELHNVINNDIPHAPEMESFPVPNFDPNVLADMVWEMDMSTQAGVDMSDHYDTSSALWQASMQYREQV
ncbi:hypothetical protein L195_g060211, partial [Trifolium pratense]